MSIVTSDPQVSHAKLAAFLTRWSMTTLEAMTLEQYSRAKRSDTFTWWLEPGSTEIGEIGGNTTSKKFGIWSRASDNEGTASYILVNDNYKWFRKYGDEPETAFRSVKAMILDIIRYARAGQFSLIDNIEIDSMVKWKTAFIYSDYRLLPVYKQSTIRIIAKHFEHPDYAVAPMSELHQFILAQKQEGEDFFDFSSRYYQIATLKRERNFYIIGSKYGDENGNDNVDIFPDMLKKSAVATGFFWNYDFTGLVGKDHHTIGNWMANNIAATEEKWDAAARTLKYFLNLQKGDLIAVKSHGRFNMLTIIAYAVVKEVNGSVYQFADPELGHLVHVDFLETGLHIDTGLNYAQTIHRIVQGERLGHFEKIFGSYAITGLADEFPDDETYYEEEPQEDPNDESDDIRLKDTTPYKRSASAEKMVRQIHNQLQNAFAAYLKKTYPNDPVKTERSRIDIWRKNKTDFFIYEIKPYNSAYTCIREALGQLTDYAFSKKSKLNTHLIVVGSQEPDAREKQYIKFLNQKTDLNLSYTHYAVESDTGVSYS